MEKEELKELLEKRLMIFYPEKYIPQYIKTTQDIFENRSILKLIKYNNDALNFLLKIILNDINEKRRFRKIDCLKTVKAIVKNRDENEAIDQKVISNLFKLYKEFILRGTEEIRWCVSAYLKDQLLEEDEIKWLMDNYRKSDHIVNRLLRYPQENPLVTDWAKGVYLNKELKNRGSEVIAILIDEDIPDYVDKTKPKKLIWAIYYSKKPDGLKQKLIEKYYRTECLDDALEVSLRLGYPSVIEFILRKLNQEP